MEMSISEQRLREYVENDKIYQDYKKSNKEPSDFERFCYTHCRDIENVLDELGELKNKILIETTNFCSECPSHECCPEDVCVLYRIEKILDKVKE
jgi:hypothetical protein